MDGLKRCARCREDLPPDAFYSGRHWRDGKHPWCKSCVLAAQKHHWREHGERKTGRRWARGQNLREDYFAVIDSPAKAYILGLLAADGSVLNHPPYHRITLELSVQDLELLQRVRDELSPGQTIRQRVRPAASLAGGVGGAGTFAILSFSSARMAADLARHGVVPNKSLSLAWPALPGPMNRPFLLGYFDGDGFVTSAVRTDGVTCPYWALLGTHPFLTAAIGLIRHELGVRVAGPWPKGRISLVRAAGHSARAVDTWLHQDGLGLERKRVQRVEFRR